MSKVIEYKQKVQSIEKIHDLVKAMQIIAVTQLKKVQEKQKTAENFCQQYENIVRQLGLQCLKSQMVKQPVCLVYVFVSQRGFCGGFNEQLCVKINEYIKAHTAETVHLIVVGARGAEVIKQHFPKQVKNTIIFEWAVDFFKIAQEAQKARQLFVDDQVVEVALIYNRFKSMLVQIPTIKLVLPFDLSAQSVDSNILIEPSLDQIRPFAVEQYLKALFYNAFMQSQLGETGARLMTMRQATDSSKEMIDSLNIQLNKARQALITSELSEIVSSFEAISGEE